MAKYSSRKKRKYSRKRSNRKKYSRKRSNRKKYSRKRSNRRKYSRKRSNRRKYSRRKYSRKKKLYNQMGGADQVDIVHKFLANMHEKKINEAMASGDKDALGKLLKKQGANKLKYLDSDLKDRAMKMYQEMVAKDSTAAAKAEKWKVLFDFKGAPQEGEGTIPLRKGEVVVVTDKSHGDKGWWDGHVEGNPANIGFFPADFVEKIGEDDEDDWDYEDDEDDGDYEDEDDDDDEDDAQMAESPSAGTSSAMPTTVPGSEGDFGFKKEWDRSFMPQPRTTSADMKGDEV